MRIFFHYKFVFLSAMVFLSLTKNLYAQDIEKEDSLSTETVQSSWLYDAYKTIHNASKHNPEYLRNGANRLKVRLLGSLQTHFFSIHPKSDIEKKIVFDSDPLTYVGAEIGWNIFAVG